MADSTVQWPEERAQDWCKTVGWRVGVNFTPSTAANVLEMWQKETFDPGTIDRELKWLSDLGMNTVRVFLHYLPWRKDQGEFLGRLDQFLATADRYKIGTMFVLFDDVWDPEPKSGSQKDPTPHVMMSTWVQCPGKQGLLDEVLQDNTLREYVQSVIGRFQKDKRVLIWDLYNEPGNPNIGRFVTLMGLL